MTSSGSDQGRRYLTSDGL